MPTPQSFVLCAFVVDSFGSSKIVSIVKSRTAAEKRTCVAGDHATTRRLAIPAVCVFLLALVFCVFGQTVRHNFVNYDDDDYVYENPQVTPGLTARGIGWAFSQSRSGNWHPLTWMSHMLDCQLFGLWAGGHHRTNVLLHAATAILLFLVLRRMTGRLWPSALAAAIFAVHPLRVESVAWVTERKDVLSGMFFMLTLWAYACYAGRPFSLARVVIQTGGDLSCATASAKQWHTAEVSPIRTHHTGYLAVVAVFALGLLCKPMLVTLPFLLLLLDFWPLGRLGAQREAGGRGVAACIVEKIPLAALSAASCAATLLVQTPALAESRAVPLSLRIANALVSCATYVGETFFPAGLAVLYPYPVGGLPGWKIAGASALLLGISAAAVVFRRRCPYLLVGWLWYLGMLVPVLGLVQVGSQAMADRYTYLPQIGLCVAVVWGAERLSRDWPGHRWIGGAASALVLAILSGCAWWQTSQWRDSTALWTHTLAHTSGNFVAHSNYGVALRQQGKVDEAERHYRQALEIHPDFADAHVNLGLILFARGQVEGAIAQYRSALAASAEHAEAHRFLGEALQGCGRLDEAIAEYQEAVAIEPDRISTRLNLGAALRRQGRIDEAIAQYQTVLAARPDYGEAENNLGNALVQKGRLDEAMAHYQKALAINPAHAEAHYNLAGVLLQKGRLDEAIAGYRRALAIRPDYADAHQNLAIALYRHGDAAGAKAHASEAERLRARRP